MTGLWKTIWEHCLINYLWRRFCLHWQFQVTLPRLRQVTLAGIKLDVSNHTRVMRKIISEGAYEAQERRLARRYLGAEDSVLELGGAIGFMGLFCQQEIGIKTYVTVEANPMTADILRKNYHLNGREPQLLNVAVAEHDGTVLLNTAGEFWENSVTSSAPITDTAIEVPAVRLETLLTRLSFCPNALIVDVEGAEQFIGFTSLPLTVTKVLIELHPRLIGTEKTFGIVAALISCGFHVVEELEYTFVFLRKSSSATSQQILH